MVKAIISFIRELVATILYIIQEFYRNTNWIDLHGNTTYKDFGKNNNTLTSILIDRKDYCFLSNLRDCYMYPLVIKFICHNITVVSDLLLIEIYQKDAS